ncbi:Uncharacterised protein [uncultured Roseburia sp.]|uniref:Uncharacterized protein n=1 Tax=Brotonthovivens ammoniilytica TaxID=2981725 RepID=A0ABT2TMF2_9FIRM|nr:hypothetical protein [Brotonthovivens ammoniilytica]MCU6763341.1 hypothetical protein [Brotonthovivens ammoniilytica]SCJ14147.1 Uncharacterised protein [uncultured Roseburia sp.]
MSRMDEQKVYSCIKKIEKQLESPADAFDWQECFLELLGLAARLNHRRILEQGMELAGKCYTVLNEVDEEVLLAVRRRYCLLRKTAGGRKPAYGWDYLCGLYRKKAAGQKDRLRVFHKVWNSVRLLHMGLLDEETAVLRICSVWEEFLKAVPSCLWTEEYFSESAELLRQGGKWQEYGMYVQFLLEHISEMPDQLLKKVQDNMKIFGL